MFAKVFEHKWVIRFFGIALILAPFINTASSVLEIPNLNKSFLLSYCWQFFKSAPAPQQILQVASVLIGALMLRGAISAWKFTLALLGAYIILQFTQLSGGARDNTTWLFLGTNIICFFFIADQLVLKPRPAAERKQELSPTELTSAVSQTPVATSSATTMAKPVLAQPHSENVTPIAAHHSAAARESAKKVYVNFEGFGNWATISDISESGIKVKAISPAPPEITSRTIELSLSPELNFKLKFHQQDGAEYAFNFVNLSSVDKHSLNQWLLATAA